ncbi:MAG: potassium transporter TrkH, partial [Parvularculaceae bacterium]
MPDLRPIILVLGVLIGALGVAMLVPMAADLSMDDPVLRAEWRAFAVTSALCLIIGGGMFLTTTGSVQKITLQQSFLISALSWLVLVIFAAIPFYLGRYTLSPTDAFFESMSALTTTGATVIVGLDEAPF